MNVSQKFTESSDANALARPWIQSSAKNWASSTDCAGKSSSSTSEIPPMLSVSGSHSRSLTNTNLRGVRLGRASQTPPRRHSKLRTCCLISGLDSHGQERPRSCPQLQVSNQLHLFSTAWRSCTEAGTVETRSETEDAPRRNLQRNFGGPRDAWPTLLSQTTPAVTLARNHALRTSLKVKLAASMR